MCRLYIAIIHCLPNLYIITRAIYILYITCAVYISFLSYIALALIHYVCHVYYIHLYMCAALYIMLPLIYHLPNCTLRAAYTTIIQYIAQYVRLIYRPYYNLPCLYISKFIADQVVV